MTGADTLGYSSTGVLKYLLRNWFESQPAAGLHQLAQRDQQHKGVDDARLAGRYASRPNAVLGR